MSTTAKLFALCAVSLALTACGKSEPATAPAPATQSAKTVTAATQQPAAMPKAPVEESKEVTYRPVNARLRDSGESVVIMVPDDVDVESGRMLEYRVGDDGTYYLRSVIPQ